MLEMADESVIDPKTGKNITLAAGADKMPGAGDVEAADGAPAAPGPPTSWPPRVG